MKPPAASLTEAQVVLTQQGSRQVQESANTHVCQWLTQTTWGKIAQTSLIPCRELVTGASMLLTVYREGNRKEKKTLCFMLSGITRNLSNVVVFC